MADLDKLIELNEHLIAVRSLPSWQRVRDEIFQPRLQVTLRSLIRNNPMTAQDLDFTRGYGAGIEYVLQTIEEGEKSFNAAMAKRKQSEEES